MKMVHVTIHTACFEESLQFYKDIIRLSIDRDMRPVRNMVFLCDAPHETCIELIEDEHAEPVRASALSVGFHAVDIDGMYAQLKEAGFAVSETVSPTPAVRFFFVNDPNGLRVQII